VPNLIKLLMHKRMSFRSALDVVASLAMLGAAMVVAVVDWPARGRSPEQPVPTEPISIERAQAVGRSTAKIVIVEFSDFQCPFCMRFATETWSTLRAEYVDTGRVQVVFRHLLWSTRT